MSTSGRIFACRFCLSVLFVLFLVVGCATNRSSVPTDKTSTSKDTWDRYEPASLKHLKTTLFDYPENQVGMTINAAAAARPYRISGNYLGELRPISNVKVEFIRKWWGSALKIGEDFTHLFENELLFEVEGAQYWMPVQRQVLPYFHKELTKGDAIDLYVMILGTIDNENEHEWIIIVNEFQKTQLPPPYESRDLDDIIDEAKRYDPDKTTGQSLLTPPPTIHLFERLVRYPFKCDDARPIALMLSMATNRTEQEMPAINNCMVIQSKSGEKIGLFIQDSIAGYVEKEYDLGQEIHLWSLWLFVNSSDKKPYFVINAIGEAQQLRVPDRQETAPVSR